MMSDVVDLLASAIHDGVDFSDLSRDQLNAVSRALAIAYWDDGEILALALRQSGFRIRFDGRDANDLEIAVLIERLHALGGLGHFLDQLMRNGERPRVRDAIRNLSVQNGDRGRISTLLAEAGSVNSGAALLVIERTIRENSVYRDLIPWLRKLEAISARVCRVEETGNAALGTGFLVGPNLVLTNWHVVRDHLGRQDGGEQLFCRFDFHVENGQEARGKVVPLATDWQKKSQPYSSDPGPLDLDYALLCLNEPIAADQISIGRLRGWISLRTTAPDPKPKDTVYVVQHPRALPMKLAMGEVTYVHGTQIRYDANTDPGSSGSPCFDESLELVALHHAGGPDGARLGVAAYNQGILTERIRADLESAGLMALIPDEAARA